MKKLFLFGLVFFGLLLSTSASAFYFTSFETSGEWSAWDIPNFNEHGSYATPTDAVAYSGLYSVEIDSSGGQVGATNNSISASSTIDGRVGFWVKHMPDATTTWTTIEVVISDSIYANNFVGLTASTTNADLWTYGHIEWRNSDYKSQICLADVCSGWRDYDGYWGGWGGTDKSLDFNLISIGSSGIYDFASWALTYFYFDDVLFYETPVSPEGAIEPVLDVFYPYECTFTTIATASSTINFNALGSITIPSTSNYHYYAFYVWTQNASTGVSTSTYSSISLEAGDMYSYNVPISVDLGSYKIWYSLVGYDVDTYGPIDHTYYCSDTGFGDTTPAGEVWYYIYPEQYVIEEEDCSGLSTLERLVCEIKNFLSGMFIPSQEKMDQFNAITKSLNNRFPRSYINEFKDFWLDFKTLTHSEVPITTIAGKELQFLDVFPLENSQGENFFTRLRELFGYALYLLFVVWVIKMIKELFFD